MPNAHASCMRRGGRGYRNENNAAVRADSNSFFIRLNFFLEGISLQSPDRQWGGGGGGWGVGGIGGCSFPYQRPTGGHLEVFSAKAGQRTGEKGPGKLEDVPKRTS
jgi:hypothetical protein